MDRIDLVRRGLLLVLVAAGAVGIESPCFAFHDGGVAACGGCHLMHDTAGGAVVGGLLAEFPSDLCLTCHAENQGAVLGSDPLFPPPEKGGGNFVFLLEDNLNDAPDGAQNPIPGEAAGHNVVAPGHGLAGDGRHTVAPGGTFPSQQLGCTSCHDPHGNAGFRLLHGVGPIQGGIASFSHPAPDATGISLVVGSETATNHTAYRGGMSDWCANCHGPYHDSGGTGFEHPGDHSLDREIADQYNFYNGDADPGGGNPATAYLPEVAFEDAGNRVDSTAGPTGTSRVMCLTCHRAHASSAPPAGRWDFNVALLAEDGVVSGSYPITDPYGSPSQGTLCSKCHEGGAPVGRRGAPPPAGLRR